MDGKSLISYAALNAVYILLIPSCRYKRPKQLGLAEIAADLLVNEQMYPGQVSLGGNTGKVNTFTGIDLGNLVRIMPTSNPIIS